MIETTKKTKIVCTIGPVTQSEEMLIKLLKAGMNVMRMNFSHGDFAEHQIKIDNLKKAIAKTGIAAATFQDLGGPKIRTGEFGTESGRVTIKNGQKFTLTTDKVVGDESRVSISYTKLPAEAKVGERIMLDDGKKQLLITEIKGKEIITKVIAGGELKGRRGVNLPDTDLSISSLTDKDKADIAFGLKNKVDFFALSFVRRPSDVQELREILDKAKSKAGIISKIETPQALENIDEIIRLSDALMVARGDLAVEIPAEEVPLAQKMMIKKCNRAGIPVITATQMLESMIKSPVPTRAEVSDIANAILDGTDAVMLSEETTLGDFPIEAVSMMSRVAYQVEKDAIFAEKFMESKRLKRDHDSSHVVDAVTSESVDLAHHTHAKCLVTLTTTGRTARMVSRYKPMCPIYAFTPNQETYNKLVLSFGVEPVMMPKIKILADMMPFVRTYLSKNKIVKKGEKTVVVAGIPFGKAVDTNMMMVDTLQ
jgi:pyruvate kinase